MREEVLRYSWMVRPCPVYEDEYNDCKSFRSRFYQFFIHGKFIDCNIWKRDFNNCVKWRSTLDDKAFDEIIANEQCRRTQRILANSENDVWEERNEPPPWWNSELPPHIIESTKNSYLKFQADCQKGMEGKKPLEPAMIPSEVPNCVIL